MLCKICRRFSAFCTSLYICSTQAETEAIEAQGQAIAEAKAHAEAASIEGNARYFGLCATFGVVHLTKLTAHTCFSVKQAELKAQALRISAKAVLETMKKKQEADLAFQRSVPSSFHQVQVSGISFCTHPSAGCILIINILCSDNLMKSMWKRLKSWLTLKPRSSLR